jgi:dTDP-glucose 4,6-dehydratase
MKPCPPLPKEDLDHILNHTRELWEEARGQSFFITGGTGFFGMWLLESFAHVNDALDLGMRAVVLTRSPESFAQKAPHLASRADLQFIQGDIRDFVFPEWEFPYVVHAATEASARLNEEAPHEMLDAIIGGTRRVLDFAAQAGVKKLLLTSSGAVYGKQPSEMTHISEDYTGAPDPLLPSSAYGEGKRVAEHMCAVHAKRFGYEVKIARCFAFVGPHLPMDGPYAIGNFIQDALEQRPIRVKGDGSPFRSYLYAADLAVWLWTLLFRGMSGRALNVGSEDELSISAVAREVAKAAGSQSEVLIKIPTLERSSTVSRYVPSVDLARRDLGLECKISLQEALNRTIAWNRHFHESI